jgi:hypothetical protein
MNEFQRVNAVTRVYGMLPVTLNGLSEIKLIGDRRNRTYYTLYLRRSPMPTRGSD